MEDMPRSGPTPKDLKRKLLRLADGLRERFGAPKRPRRKSILDALIQTLLSQGTTDHNRDLAFAELKKQYPSWESAADATQSALARAVRSAGLGNQKARSIRALLLWLRKERGALSLEFLHEKTDAEAVDLLTAQSGIGVKTAYVTLMWAAGRDLFAVDVHIHRIAKRLGLIGEKTSPLKAHGVLGPHIPKGRAFELHMNMLALGRTICMARSPLCGQCPFRRMCPYYRALRSQTSTKPPSKRESTRAAGPKARKID